MALYNPDEFDNLLADIDFEDAEAHLEAVRADLDGLHEVQRSEAIARQLLRLGKTVKSLEADKETLTNHASETGYRLTSVSRRIDSLKSWMLNLYEQGGLTDKVKDSLVTVYTQKNPASCEVFDEAAVPGAYKRVTVAPLPYPLAMEILPTDVLATATISVNKQQILQDLKETGTVPEGIAIVNDRKSLRVK